jgi:hypothetical protein
VATTFGHTKAATITLFGVKKDFAAQRLALVLHIDNGSHRASGDNLAKVSLGWATSADETWFHDAIPDQVWSDLPSRKI